MSGILDRLNKLLEDGIRENVILSSYSSFGIGGPARYFFTAQTTSQLVRAVRAARTVGIKFFVLGGGSNILFDDTGFSGLVIKDMTDKFRINGGIVSALSGTIVDRLVDATGAQGLGGMEYAAGIQGTIGGAVHGNAGAFGHAINEILESAVILTEADKIEVADNEYFKLAERSIPRLAALYPDFTGQELQMNGDYSAIEPENEQQLSMILADKPVSYKTKSVVKHRRNGARH